MDFHILGDLPSLKDLLHPPSLEAYKDLLHPPVEDLPSLEAYMKLDPANIIHVFPAILAYLEQRCLAQNDLCEPVWQAFNPLLADIIAKSSNNNQNNIQRPLSPKCEEKQFTTTNVHNETRHDPYAWLTDRENKEVLEYIDAENKYAFDVLADSKPLQKLLYKEFVSRLDESEETPKTTLSDGYSYYTKRVPGQDYRVHCRCRPDGVEEIYIDENEMANSKTFEDASYFKVGFLKHDPLFKMVAYSVDSSGNERYTVRFMMIDTKEILNDTIEGVYEDFEFSNDGLYVFYTLLDDCERAYQLKRHKIGSPVEDAEVLYHEEDEMFYLSMTKSCNMKYLILNSAAQITSETRYISSEDALGKLHMLLPRREGIQYTCEIFDHYFYILTNEGTKNNWLCRIPIPKSQYAENSWETLLDLRETVIEHRDFVLVEDFQLRKGHLIVFERSNCLQNIRIVDLSVPGFSSYHYVGFSEMVYSLWPGAVDDEVADLTKAVQVDTDIFRFTYTSFLQPKQVIDYNMTDRTMTVIHDEQVGGLFPYDQTLYHSKRLFALGVDGTAIPVSIVYRRDLLGMNMHPSQVNPLLLHGYGAYGSFVNPIFSANRLSLLDRGFIYAVAHVRGGADMGNGWYEEGKLLKKPNTFHDFISVAEYLCKEGYTSPEKLAIYGRSAGGLLIGACMNMRPDLFRAALTEVPFVDVINTMFDSTIPWTAFEYEEWGNPNDREIYEVMKTYCPYSNIRGDKLANEEYPNLLVVCGMNDPRVAFFEPLKFVAKMRGEKRKHQNTTTTNQKNTTKTTTTDPKEKRLLLLKVDDVGHGGNSGQYSPLEDLAFEYAFLIHSLSAPSKPFQTGFQHHSLTPNPALFSPITSPLMLRRDPSKNKNLSNNNSWMLRTPPPGKAGGVGSEGHSRSGTVNSSLSSLTDVQGVGVGGSVKKERKERKKRTKDEVEDKKYRGNNRENKVFHWVNSWF